eukprot:gene2061-biopygen2710
MGNKKVDGAWLCGKHGGSTTKPCTHAGCTTMGQKKVDGAWLCVKHGGSGKKTCTHDGCTTMGNKKVDGSWMCVKHGGKETCTHAGCTTMGRKKIEGSWKCHKHMAKETPSSTSAGSPSLTPLSVPSVPELATRITEGSSCSNRSSGTGDVSSTQTMKPKNVHKRSLTLIGTPEYPFSAAGQGIQSMTSACSVAHPLPKSKRERLMTDAEHCPAPVCVRDNADGHMGKGQTSGHQWRGKLLPASEISAPMYPVPAPPTHTKYCSKCGGTHPGSSHYCPVDGTLLSFAKFCQKCGALWPKVSYAFCGKDGSPLVSATIIMTQ